MKLTQDMYPVFEANQVLSDEHLNEIFDYLDEQDRLTRANLIGIGIVCGLQIGLDTTGDAPVIRLTKGCGTTSEGYLIIEPQDVDLVSYRAYSLPDEPDYLPLRDRSSAGKPFDLWELFPAGEPETIPLGDIPRFLDNKAVLLFLELRKEALRNCSPNNCDDKGAKITATVRRLLINVEDLKKVVAAANELEDNLTASDLGNALLARLKLSDLRLPRYDVPSSNPATSRDVLTAFLTVFRAGKLAQQTGTALSAAYDAFKPLLQDAYPSNPFTGFAGLFGFLDTAPATTAQVKFLPYYYDFFDDVLKAYDEFRWKGARLLCACCPPESLFPRHLMLGVLDAGAVPDASIYRQVFVSSPAVGDCSDRTQDLRQLFQRIVEMIKQFSNSPKLAQAQPRSLTDSQIRLTPSKTGDVPLSAQAIPYYYAQDGAPPLYRLWSPEKTRRDRANQNLSYRSDQYQPTAPPFVTDALRYDLEPYNFLRVEGHLGKPYQNVLGTLLSLKARYRLPIEIIALRAGTFDDDIAVDLSNEQCKFQDLETLYDALREELLSALSEGVMFLYGVPLEAAVAGLTAGVPNLPLLKKYAPNFRYGENTVGAWYEKYLALFEGRPYIDVDQNNVNQNAVLTVYCVLFSGTVGLQAKNFAHVVSIYYLMKLAEVLPDTLDALGFADFQNKYQDLMGLVRFFRSEAVNNISEQFKDFIPQEELIDHFDEVLFSCKLEPIRAIHDEYLRRLRDVKQKMFFSTFLQNHPGIQHKAGVPMGGTFLLVYHEEPSPLKKDIDLSGIRAGLAVKTAIAPRLSLTTDALSAALSRMSVKAQYADDPDVKVLFGALTGQVPDFKRPVRPAPVGDRIIDAAIAELQNGTVIADFFLPYLYCSACSPIQFVLPKPPPSFTVQIACANADNQAEVVVTPQGGDAPYAYNVDGGDFQPLTGALSLSAGEHTIVIKDSAGIESAPKPITVPATLTLGQETYDDNVAARTYQVSVPISGGTAPYQADTGVIKDNLFTSGSVKSGEGTTVTITDSVGCKVSKQFTHAVCDLPCEGLTVRCGYRFWLPMTDQKRFYTFYEARVESFQFEFPQGESVDLNADVNSILQSPPDALRNTFDTVVQLWITRINGLIDKKTQKTGWMRLEYSRQPDEPVGTLWIERFECLKFDFRIAASFKRPEMLEQVLVQYTPEGTVMKFGEGESTIPPYNCVETNKCNPQRAAVVRCADLDLSVTIVKKVGRAAASPTVALDVRSTGQDTPVAYLWEVQDAVPPISDAKKATFKFQNRDPLRKTVRLTVFTERGCAVSATDAIDLPE